MSQRAVLAGCVAVLAIAGLQAQPVFRGGVDLVTFGVTVVDRKGNLITDLTQDDFEVRRRRRAAGDPVIRARRRADVLSGLRLGLMLDTSGSMERDLTLARTAAIKFLNALPEAEDITLVDFDTRGARHPLPAARFRRGSSSGSGA